MNKDVYIRIRREGKIIYETKVSEEDNIILEGCYNHFTAYIKDNHCVDGIVMNDDLLDICKSDLKLHDICKLCNKPTKHDFCEVIPKKGENRKGIYFIADIYTQNSYCPCCGEGIDNNEDAHSKDVSGVCIK